MQQIGPFMSVRGASWKSSGRYDPSRFSNRKLPLHRIALPMDY